MSEVKTKDTRSKNWTIVQYDDSSPADWRDIINDMHIEWIESPIHDKDLNADGEVKKSHRHIMLMFGSLKSYDQVRELADKLNCPSPQKCHNSKAMVRYMAHLDNPEKAQYDIAEIRGYGGVDISELLRPSASERYNIIRDMMNFVRAENITEFQDLMDFAMTNKFDEWFPLLCDNSSIVMINYIKSVRHRTSKAIDYATGEVSK